jgi:glycosyltransferase involved in cell wall biosynthesis
VITTPIGARGLDVESYEHVIISSTAEFPKKIAELLKDRTLQERLRKNGRSLVTEKFSWDKIALDVFEKLKR